MGSVQLCGVVPTARLPLLSADLASPHPPTETLEDSGKVEQACVTIAAGKYADVGMIGFSGLNWLKI